MLQPVSPQTIKSLKTKIELNCWLKKENAMWLQRSHMNLFQSSDRNTRFFHAKALARYNKNLIDGLMNSNDVWHEEEDEVQGIVLDYYTNIFTSSNLQDFEEIIQVV